MARTAALLIACGVCCASAAENAWSFLGHRQPEASDTAAAQSVLAQGQRMLQTVQMPQKAATALHSLLARVGQSLVVVNLKMTEANQDLVDFVKADTDLDVAAVMINQTLGRAQAAYTDLSQEFRDALYPFGKTLNEVAQVFPEFPTNGSRVNEKVNHAMMEVFMDPFQEGMNRFRGFTNDFKSFSPEKKLRMIREINTGLDAGYHEQKALLKMPAMDLDKATAAMLGLLPEEMSLQAKSIKKWTALLPRQNLNAYKSLADAVHIATATLGIKWGYGPDFTEGARVETPLQASVPQQVAAFHQKQNLAAVKKVFGLLSRRHKVRQ